MINSTIGKYRVIRKIGEGGMASVYEAVHPILQTKAAIKILNPTYASNQQIRERFRDEAKIMASMDHVNIIRVIDFDEIADRLCIVMEYLEGEDLNSKVRRDGPLSEKSFVHVYSQILDALQYAHERQIAHRDIKPSNIFITKNGQVKILDFGIAKIFGDGLNKTHTGALLGTPIYMSPEQVKAEKSIDHRTDIYSLGVTMYFAITGKPPYSEDDESWFQISNKIVHEPLPKVNLKFQFMIEKACKKNRNERYQECKEWHTVLNSPSNDQAARQRTILPSSVNDSSAVYDWLGDILIVLAVASALSAITVAVYKYHP